MTNEVFGEQANAGVTVKPENTPRPTMQLARMAFAAAASPRVTTVLIIAAIVLVLLGTLAQVYMDIWEVVNDYFRAWIAWVDLKVFFPPTFFPWAALTQWESLPIESLPFPGGALIGLALAVNLVAAHGVRFKIQVRGLRLAVGLSLLAAGIAATWGVIQAGHNHHGVQGEPWLAWSTLWLLLRIALGAVFVVCLSGLVWVWARVRVNRTLELVVLGVCTVTSGMLLTWVLVHHDAALLNDSSLRILYHLIQAEVAALVLLAGCAFLFQKRAGSVLLHGGIGLMMFGEFFVSRFAQEQQMTLLEGETVSFTQDIRSVEVAVTNFAEAGRASVVTIPTELNGKSTRFIDGRVVQLDGHTFDAVIVRYFKNSTIRSVRSGESNLATHGPGATLIAENAAPTSGTQRGQIDLASAYVRLIDRTTRQVLGTFLLSQHFSTTRMLSNSISVAGNTYGLELRFKRYQKPYQITLLDVRKDDYIGTTMPRNYSSQIRLTDASRDMEFETKIWMNNPLRYAGETFYQSGYSPGGGRGETSTFQVVKNRGWMIPYVSCMILATGMLAHFFIALVRFLRRGSVGDAEPVCVASRDRAPVLSSLHATNGPPALVRWLVPLAVVVLAVVYLASKAAPASHDSSTMNLTLFGELPLVYEGRVKPFDTLARNSLRVISNRETFVDAHGDKQPAIRWLLDVIASPESAADHRVFRIDNLETLNALDLEPRSGFRYSWKELQAKSPRFQEQVLAAQTQDAQLRTLQQRKILQLRQRVDHYRLLIDAFQPMALPPFPTQEEIARDGQQATERMTAIGRRIQEIPRMSENLSARQPPLSVPVGSADRPWRAYASARNESYIAEHYRQQAPAPALAELSAILDAFRSERAADFNAAVANYRRFLDEQPPEGLDQRMVRFEAFFNRVAPFYSAIPLYATAFLLTAFSWLAAVAWPRVSESMRSATFWFVVVAFAVHTLALGARVVISGRPPVTNLYSSAVFVGWGCVGLGLLLELAFRLGIGNLVAAVSGVGTLLIAHLLAADGDTIKVLQAVLDTQFWLTVHVLTITLGYSATFLAGLLGIVLVGYLCGKHILFRLDCMVRRPESRRLPSDWLSPSRPSDAEKIVAGMIYGTVCFAALFGLVGTVLGGLWADDSWGRFWGWDPKENGALLVVLWNALILHARAARMIRERGLALLAIAGNIVTAWSWFGVNELGVGLHSYGFTEGVSRALWLFWCSQLLLIALGVLLTLIANLWYRQPAGTPAQS